MDSKHKNNRGGKREGAGRKALQPHLKKERAGNLRITRYKTEALKTLPVSLGDAIETALDEKCAELFEAFLREYEKNLKQESNNRLAPRPEQAGQAQR